MNQIDPEVQNNSSTYMCIADNCLANPIFQQNNISQHEEHKTDYFDIYETISQIQDSQNELKQLQGEYQNDLKRLDQEVVNKKKAIEELNGKIHVKFQLNYFNQGNMLMSGKIDYYLTKFDLISLIQLSYINQNYGQIHRKNQFLDTQIESTEIFSYQNFHPLQNKLPLMKFKKGQTRCHTHKEQQIEYLRLDKSIDLVQRTGCTKCAAETKYPLPKCKEFIEQMIDQEKLLEKIINLAQIVKKFRNQILKSFKHLIIFLDIEIKENLKVLQQRQQKFNLMLPQDDGDFSLSHYQQIGELLSENITNLNSITQIANYFSKNGQKENIDKMTKFMADMNRMFESLTEDKNINKLFNEQEDKYRLTLEVIRKRGDLNEAQKIKGYEIMVPKNQKISNLLSWVKTKECLLQDTVLRFSINHVIFDLNKNDKWRDCAIQNGAIIHVIFE